MNLLNDQLKSIQQKFQNIMSPVTKSAPTLPSPQTTNVSNVQQTKAPAYQPYQYMSAPQPQVQPKPVAQSNVAPRVSTPKPVVTQQSTPQAPAANVENTQPKTNMVDETRAKFNYAEQMAGKTFLEDGSEYYTNLSAQANEYYKQRSRQIEEQARSIYDPVLAQVQEQIKRIMADAAAERAAMSAQYDQNQSGIHAQTHEADRQMQYAMASRGVEDSGVAMGGSIIIGGERNKLLAENNVKRATALAQLQKQYTEIQNQMEMQGTQAQMAKAQFLAGNMNALEEYAQSVRDKILDSQRQDYILNTQRKQQWEDRQADFEQQLSMAELGNFWQNQLMDKSNAQDVEKMKLQALLNRSSGSAGSGGYSSGSGSSGVGEDDIFKYASIIMSNPQYYDTSYSNPTSTANKLVKDWGISPELAQAAATYAAGNVRSDGKTPIYVYTNKQSADAAGKKARQEVLKKKEEKEKEEASKTKIEIKPMTPVKRRSIR